MELSVDAPRDKIVVHPDVLVHINNAMRWNSCVHHAYGGDTLNQTQRDALKREIEHTERIIGGLKRQQEMAGNANSLADDLARRYKELAELREGY